MAVAARRNIILADMAISLPSSGRILPKPPINAMTICNISSVGAVRALGPVVGIPLREEPI